MDGKQLRHIRALRAMGATYVRMGSLEVHFAPVQVKTEDAEVDTAGAMRAILDDALNEFHEAVDDQREVTSLEENQKKRAAVKQLTYAHS